MMNNWMMKCEELSRLVSQALDRTLPLHQRLGIRMHLMMCSLCTQNFRQLLALRQTMKLFMKKSDRLEPAATLSPDKKEEIKEQSRRAAG
jgi:predicted anti-sigma-YlaC factor YlaD